jgi:hypothetical protein
MSMTPSADPTNERAASEATAFGTARVSAKSGWWSVGLALGSAVVFWIIGSIVAIAMMAIFGGMGRVPQEVGGAVSIVIHVLVIAMVIAAMIFGVTSIVRAFTQVGDSGRVAAIVLGGIGVVLSTAMGWLLLMPYL